jgi:hypothetical protein
MGKNYYVSGEFNLTCDRCSKKIKAHQAKHEWTGFIVCRDCYENRHPQDFVKAQTDKITVPFQRPIPTYLFTDINYTIYWDDGYATTYYVEQGNL